VVGLAGLVVGWVLRDQSIPVSVPAPCHCRCECITSSSGLNIAGLIFGLILASLGVVFLWKGQIGAVSPPTPTKGGKGVYGGIGKAVSIG
jgi:hypothetical protein